MQLCWRYCCEYLKTEFLVLRINFLHLSKVKKNDNIANP